MQPFAREVLSENARRDRLRGPDWAMSRQMMARAADAIIRRDIRLCTDFDVPYLAGYSLDGRTIYIDKDFRPAFTSKEGRKADANRYLFIHEVTEKTLLLGLGLCYQHAHQIALHVEQATVRADGIGWEEYDDFVQPQVKEADEDMTLTLPPDLDLTPYEDEHDAAMLKRMAEARRKPTP